MHELLSDITYLIVTLRRGKCKETVCSKDAHKHSCWSVAGTLFDELLTGTTAAQYSERTTALSYAEVTMQTSARNLPLEV